MKKLALAIVALFLCSSCSQQAPAERTGQASGPVDVVRDAQQHVQVELDARDNKSRIEHIDAAWQYMVPILNDPQLIKPKYEQDVSFDATPPRLVSVAPQDVLRSLEDIGKAYEDMGAWDKASDAWAKTLKFIDAVKSVEPKSFSARNVTDFKARYARCLVHRGQLKESKPITDAILADPLSTNTEYGDLGVIAIERGDSPTDVEHIYDLAVKATPETQKPLLAHYLGHRGDARFAEKKYADALADYKAAYDISAAKDSSSQPELLLHRSAAIARVYWQQGQHAKALSTLQSAFKQLKNQNHSRCFVKHNVELAYYLTHTPAKEAEAKAALATVEERALSMTGASCPTSDNSAWRIEAQKLQADAKTITHDPKAQLDKLETGALNYPCNPFFP
ncbi:MAG: hypothetical protein U0105_21450 [Candidatus Obscuribacterales bacterium]